MEQQTDKKAHTWSMDTLLIHGDSGIENTYDVAPPIHVSTTFHIPNEGGLAYSRDDTITRRRAEALLGQLEGGNCVLFSSGLAACYAIFAFFKPRRIMMRQGYHGTTKIAEYLKEMRGEDKCSIIPLSKDTPLAAGDLIWLESPLNPTCEVEDIASWAAEAKKTQAFVAVDSTFASPIVCNPIKHGAHAVLHSCTKFISGHSDILAGAAILAPTLSSGRLHSFRTNLGSVPGNLETWLILRSLRTLALRVERQSETATKLAAWLVAQKDVVEKVWHPSIEGHPGHNLVGEGKLMKLPGAMLSVELKDPVHAKQLPSLLKIWANATSLGGIESLIDWRFRWDESQSPKLLRLSTGLEGFEDLTQDLRTAFDILVKQTADQSMSPKEKKLREKQEKEDAKKKDKEEKAKAKKK